MPRFLRFAACGRTRLPLPNAELEMISDVKFAGKGRFLLVANTTGGVHVWDVRRMRESLAAHGVDW